MTEEQKETVIEATEELVEEQTLTNEESIEDLRVALETYKAKAEEKEKGFKTLQSRSSELNRELERLKTQVSDRDGDREENRNLNKMLLTLLSEQTGQDELEVRNTAKSNGVAERFQAIIDEQDAKRTEREKTRQQEALNKKADSYRQQLENLKIPEKDKSYRQVKAAVLSMDFELADDILSEIKKPTDGQEPAEDADKLANKRALKILAEKGMLKSDSGSTAGSGRVFSIAEITKMSLSEYEKIKPEVDKARREGRLK